MFTTIDKAIVAFIMSVLSILNLVLGVDLGIPAETVSILVTALTPFLVYYIPNKPKIK